jgi:hypothetical protein
MHDELWLLEPFSSSALVHIESALLVHPMPESSAARRSSRALLLIAADRRVASNSARAAALDDPPPRRRGQPAQRRLNIGGQRRFMTSLPDSARAVPQSQAWRAW